MARNDLAVIIVSTNEARWLTPCLESVFARGGSLSLDVVVVDNESSDGTRDLVETEFPRARVVDAQNRGFSHANNVGLATTDARHVLFLNPDTEILDGTLEELVRAIDERPTVGLVGVRQVNQKGDLHPTMRRFPNALRLLGDACGLERIRHRPQLLGERMLDLSEYDRECRCDWTIGSFMLVRREALEQAGPLDDRFFIYSEEVDFCLRIHRAGWEIRHLPTMTILHHVEKGGEARTVNARMVRQNAYAQLQYAEKNFAPLHRRVYSGILLFKYGVRILSPGRGEYARQKRSAARDATALILGRADAPFRS